jgi:hypothetical protein
MSLMAGFDFLTEISNDTIRKLIEQNLQIGGQQIVPPFELNLPISSSGVNGSAHLIVNDLQLDLNADDTLTLTFAFDRTSVMVTSPLSLTICPLSGDLTITAAVQLVNAGGSAQQVSIDMGAAAVAINWSSAADSAISADLSGTPISPAAFTLFAQQALAGYVHSIPAPAIPVAFNVVPGTDGSLSPSLQFERLEVHCIPDASRSRQALGLFGILLAANDGHGDHTQKTATAITAASNGVCISISPGAFNKLVFCPAIAQALGTTVSHLPGSCGPAGGFNTQGVTLNSLTDSFASGHINIDGSVDKSGTCYDAHGTFHGALTFTIAGSTLTPHVAMDPPNVSVDIPWYCWLVAGVVLGPLGLVLAGIADGVANHVASSLAGSALNSALGGGISGVSLGALSLASFSSVGVTAEGLSLQGTVPVAVSAPFVMPALSLAGSVIITNSQEVSSGIFHTQVWCMPHAKDYPYTEYSQNQRGTYHLGGTLVVQPLTPHYSIDAGGPAVALTGASGTVALPSVSTHYPMPLSTGGTALNQTVHIHYAISGTTIQLTNVPAEGDYSFYLNVTATDCQGNPVQDDTYNDLSTYVQVQFEGDHVDIGGGYADDVQYCAQLLRAWLETILHEYMPYQNVPVWQQVNYPPPDGLIQYFRDLVALGLPEADEVLVASKIAHGNSFYRAIFSPAARQPDLLTAKARAAAGVQQLAASQQQLADLALQLANLSQQLQSAGSLTQAGVSKTQAKG